METQRVRERAFAADRLRASAHRLSCSADVLDMAGAAGALTDNAEMSRMLRDSAQLDAITLLLAGGAQLADAIGKVILGGSRLLLVVG